MIDLHAIGRAIAALDGRGALGDYSLVADDIQHSLLNFRLPPHDDVAAGVRSAPGRLAGGDYIDAIQTPGLPTVFAIGDVSGRSLPSAFKALSLKFALRGLLAAEPADLPRVLRLANDIMSNVVNADEYISVLLCRFPQTRDRIVYANAGHDPPLIHRVATGAVEELPASGIVLGVESRPVYQVQEAPLSPGDTVALYTDGFTEARNAAGEQFTLAEVKAGLREFSAETPQRLADQLFERIEEHTAGTFRDDASILILRIE